MKEVKVFLIETEQSIRFVFESLYGERAYTLDSLEDVGFRLPDFGPDMVLLGADIFLQDPSAADQAILVCSDIPWVLVGFSKELKRAKELGWSKETLEKPLVVGSLENTLEKLYSQLSS